MASVLLVHRHPSHHLVFHVRLGQIAQTRMAQWLSHDHFFKRRHLRAVVSQPPFAQPMVGHARFVELHRLGNSLSLQHARPASSSHLLRRRRNLSLLGVLVLRTQPFFLGVAVRVSRHHLVQCAVQWLVKID